jgi:Ca2+-binding EF-hand superfamily protein
MATQRGEEPQHISSADQAQQIFQRYDTAGTGLVDAWDIRAALKEMGKEMTDPMIFDMLRVNDTEVASVSLEKFLDMCDADVSDDGLATMRSAFRNQARPRSLLTRPSPAAPL